MDEEHRRRIRTAKAWCSCEDHAFALSIASIAEDLVTHVQGSSKQVEMPDATTQALWEALRREISERVAFLLQKSSHSACATTSTGE